MNDSNAIGAQMHRRTLAVLVPVVVAAAIAGCGSSTKAPPAKAAASASVSSSSSSGSSGSGSYGQSTAGAATRAPVALLTTKHSGKLGTVLAFGTEKLTVYLFAADKRGNSNCTGACAAVWPPVTGSPKAMSGAASADLGTITRPDGIRQVTYKGHPLYMYVRDRDAGDAYGEGIKSFGAEWYALSPAGNKVDLS